MHRAEAANSHLAGSIKRVYVTLQKEKDLVKSKLLFLPNTQANQALPSQTKKKAFMLSAVRSLGVVKHHRAQNHYGIFCIGCQPLFAGDLKNRGDMKHRRSEQQLADLNRKQGDHHKSVECIFSIRKGLLSSLQYRVRKNMRDLTEHLLRNGRERQTWFCVVGEREAQVFWKYLVWITVHQL